MENIRKLRMRIKSIENTRQITCSMKMVAASKLHRTQASSIALRTYAEKSREILGTVLNSPGKFKSPYFEKHEEGKILYVLFVGNRGLCGAYNLGVLKYLQELTENEDCEIVVVGRWGKDQFSERNITVARFFDEVSDTPTFEESQKLTDYLTESYKSGRVREVILVYQQFTSVLAQTPGHKILFPITAEKNAAASAEFIFEPNKDAIMNTLIGLYIGNTVYSVMLEARTGEHASRMAAMTAASDNTDELISSLTLKLNHARQTAITTELSEIVGGANALAQLENNQ